MNETPTQSKINMSRKSPSVMKYVFNQKSQVSNQEKEISHPESNIVKHRAVVKRP